MAALPSEIRPGDRVIIRGTVTSIEGAPGHPQTPPDRAVVELSEHPGVHVPVAVNVPVGLLEPDPETVTA
jgi:hypothetical protein